MDPYLSESAPLVLGSASPRRREILMSVRVPHVVVAASADEALRAGETHGAYLARVVASKREAVTRAIPPGLAARARAVLVADTIVVVDGEVLGKPRDVDDAERMTRRLAGRAHEVHTRFAIARVGAPASEAPAHQETVVTRVTFRSLSERQARSYAESGEGLDKAGAYAVQGLAASIVARIEGSYTNVVGLPACEVVVALTSLGLLLA